MNRSIDEMPTLMLAEFDAETRPRLGAQRSVGKVERGFAGKISGPIVCRI